MKKSILLFSVIAVVTFIRDTEGITKWGTRLCVPIFAANSPVNDTVVGCIINCFSRAVPEDRTTRYQFVLYGNTRCFCVRHMNWTCENKWESKFHNQLIDAYKTTNITVAESINTTSTLLEQGERISFIATFKTYAKQHLSDMKITIYINSTRIHIFTKQEISPKEILFQLHHYDTSGVDTALLNVVFVDSVDNVIKLSTPLTFFARKELEFTPLFDELSARVNKSINAHERKGTVLSAFQRRFLKNGSFAMGINEQLGFYFNSFMYSIMNITVEKRLDYPKYCDSKTLSKIGANCQKPTTESKSSPTIFIESNKKIVFQFSTIGIYTIILHLRDVKTNQVFHRTVRTTNFIIVEEYITNACMTINQMNGIIYLNGDMGGLSIKMNVVYTWRLSSLMEINTPIRDYQLAKPTKSLVDGIFIKLMVSNMISSNKNLASRFQILYKTLSAAYIAQPDNPILVGEVIKLNVSSFKDTNIKWILSPDNPVTVSRRSYLVKQYDKPGHERTAVILSKGKEVKRMVADIYVLDIIKPLQLHYEMDSWKDAKIYFDFRTDWYNASFFNETYNPVFTWIIDGVENRTKENYIWHRFEKRGKYQVDAMVTNIVSTYKTTGFVNVIPGEVCYKTLKVKWRKDESMIFDKTEIIELHPSLFVNCSVDKKDDLNITWYTGDYGKVLSTCLSLNIKGKDLPPETNNLILEVSINGMKTNRTLPIKITKNELKAIITPGGIRKLSPYKKVVLDGSRSFDKSDERADIRYKWSCIRNNEASCFKTDNEPLLAEYKQYKFHPSSLATSIDKAEDEYVISLVITKTVGRVKIESLPDYVLLTFKNKDITESFGIKCDSCFDGTSHLSNTNIRFSIDGNFDTTDINFKWEFNVFPNDNAEKNNYCGRKKCYPSTLLSPCGTLQKMMAGVPNFKTINSFPEFKKSDNTSSNYVKRNVTKLLKAKANRTVSEKNAACIEDETCSNLDFLFKQCDYKYNFDDLDSTSKITTTPAKRTTSSKSTRFTQTKVSFNRSSTTTTTFRPPFQKQTTPKETGIKSQFQAITTLRTTTTPKLEKLTKDALSRFKGQSAPANVYKENLPFGKEKRMILVVGGFKENRYSVTLEARRKGKLIGSVKIAFETVSSIGQAECTVHQVGYGLKKPYRVGCKGLTKKDSLIYEVQWLNNGIYETILMTQIFELNFYLPTHEAHKKDNYIRIILEDKNGFRRRLCDIFLPSERRHEANFETFEKYLNRTKTWRKTNYERPSVVGSRLLAIISSVETNSFETRRILYQSSKLVDEFSGKLIPNMVVIIIKKLFETMKKIKLEKNQMFKNVEFIINALDKIHDQHAEECFNTHWHYKRLMQRIEYNNDMANVYGKICEFLLKLTNPMNVLEQLLSQFSDFLNQRQEVYGVYLNHSTTNFHVIGLINATSEKLPSYQTDDGISVTLNVIKRSSFAYEFKAITLQVEPKKHLIYVKAKSQDIEGTKIEENDVSYSISQHSDCRDLVNDVYHVTKGNSMVHTVHPDLSKGHLHVFLGIVGRSDNHVYFDLKAYLMIDGDVENRIPLVQNNRNALNQMITSLAADRNYTVYVEIAMKEKLFKKVNGEPWFNYTISFHQPTCQPRSNDATCTKQMLSKCMLICRCEGNGFINVGVDLLEMEVKTLIQESHRGSLLPISILCTLVVLYILVILRRFHVHQSIKRNSEIIEIPENYACDPYRYQFIIETGHCIGAGTTARVCAILHGSQGHSQKMELTQTYKSLFERCSTSLIIASCPNHLGELTHLTLWHNNANNSPDWYIKQIIVKDVTENKTYYFPMHNWLSLTKGVKSPNCCLIATNKSCISKSQMFLEILLDYYTPVSLFFGPKYSNFDYFERMFYLITTILYYFMVTIVIFNDAVREYAYSIGIFHVQSRDMYWIGLLVSISFVPIGLVLNCLFRCSMKNAQDKNDWHILPRPRNNKIIDSSTINSTISSTSTRGALLYCKTLEDQMISQSFSIDSSLPAWSFSLPYWTRTLGWFVTFSITLISGTIIWLRSVTTRSEEVISWIQLAFISVIFDFFFISFIMAFIQSLLSLYAPFWGKNMECLFYKMSRYNAEDDDTTQLSAYEKTVMVRDRSRFIRYADVMTQDQVRNKRRRYRTRDVVKNVYKKISLIITLVIITTLMSYAEKNEDVLKWDESVKKVVKEIAPPKDFRKWLSTFTKLINEKHNMQIVAQPSIDIQWTDAERNSREKKSIINITNYTPDLDSVKLEFILSDERLDRNERYYSLVKVSFKKFKKTNGFLYGSFKMNTLHYEPMNFGLTWKTISLVCQVLLSLLCLLMTIVSYSKLLEKDLVYLANNPFNALMLGLSWVCSTMWIYELILYNNLEIALDNLKFSANDHNKELFVSIQPLIGFKKMWHNVLGLVTFCVVIKCLWFLKVFTATQENFKILKTGIKKVIPYLVFPSIILLACAHAAVILNASTTFTQNWESLVLASPFSYYKSYYRGLDLENYAGKRRDEMSNTTSTSHVTDVNKDRHHFQHSYETHVVLLAVFILWISVRMSLVVFIGLFRRSTQKKKKRSIHFSRLLRQGLHNVVSYFRKERYKRQKYMIPNKLSKEHMYQEIDYQLEEVLYRLNEIAKSEEEIGKSVTETSTTSSIIQPDQLSYDEFDYTVRDEYCDTIPEIRERKSNMGTGYEFTDAMYDKHEYLKHQHPVPEQVTSKHMEQRQKKLAAYHVTNQDFNENETSFVSSIPTAGIAIDTNEYRRLSQDSVSKNRFQGIKPFVGLPDAALFLPNYQKVPVQKERNEFKRVTLNKFDLENTRIRFENTEITKPVPKINNDELAGRFSRPDILENPLKKTEEQFETNMKETIRKLQEMEKKLTEFEADEILRKTAIEKSFRKKRHVKFAKQDQEKENHDQLTSSSASSPNSHSKLIQCNQNTNTSLRNATIQEKTISAKRRKRRHREEASSKKSASKHSTTTTSVKTTEISPTSPPLTAPTSLPLTTPTSPPLTAPTLLPLTTPTPPPLTAPTNATLAPVFTATTSLKQPLPKSQNTSKQPQNTSKQPFDISRINELFDKYNQPQFKQPSRDEAYARLRAMRTMWTPNISQYQRHNDGYQNDAEEEDTV